MDTCFDLCNYTKLCAASVSPNRHTKWVQPVINALIFRDLSFFSKAKPYLLLSLLLFTDCGLRHTWPAIFFAKTQTNAPFFWRLLFSFTTFVHPFYCLQFVFTLCTHASLVHFKLCKSCDDKMHSYTSSGVQFSLISSYFVPEIHSQGGKAGAMTSLGMWRVQIKLQDCKWLQTPLIQVTVVVITATVRSLLTRGGQRSWPKWLDWLQFVSQICILTFFFFFRRCFSLRTSFTQEILIDLHHVCAGRLRARVQLFLSIHACIIHGVGDFFFCGLQTLHLNLFPVYFITECVSKAAKMVGFTSTFQYYSLRRHNPVLIDSVSSFSYVVIQ